MFVSILFLSFLGTSSAQLLFNSSSVNNSHAIVENFLDKMVKTIETKDSAKISDLFADDFFFHGCKGDYDKKKIVSVLTMIPSGMNLTYKSSKSISGGKIEYFVSIAGVNPAPVDARFILSAGKLEEGSVPACQMFQRFIGSSVYASDDVQSMLERYLARMLRTIRSKNEYMINRLFHPVFIYKGCCMQLYAFHIHELLNKLSTKFTATLISFEDLGTTIKFLVLTSGFGQGKTVAEFVLDKFEQRLVSGNDPACQEPYSKSFPHVSKDSNAQTIVEKFLADVVYSIKMKDIFLLCRYFEPDFVFKGCESYDKLQRTYGKSQSMGFLRTLAATNYNFTLKTEEDRGSYIRFVLSGSISGQAEVEMVFVLNKSNLKLEKGVEENCSTLCRSILDVPEDSNAVIKRFLASMKHTTFWHNETAIKNLDDNFSFKTCYEPFTKAQAINMLSYHQAFSDFDLKSSKWNKLGQIEYTVAITDVFEDETFDAQFVFCPHQNVLKSGKHVCPGASTVDFAGLWS